MRNYVYKNKAENETKKVCKKTNEKLTIKRVEAGFQTKNKD